MSSEHDEKNRPDAESEPGSISILLSRIQSGDDGAREDLFRHLVEVIGPKANALMNGERNDHTLTAGALINEACVRMLQSDVVMNAPNRRYLYGAAHQAMCRVLVDYARTKNAAKRQGKRVQLDLVFENLEARTGGSASEFADALEALGREDPRLREVVELRFLSGFSVEHTAEIIGVHPRTVTRDWRLARARLYLLMQRGDE